MSQTHPIILQLIVSSVYQPHSHHHHNNVTLPVDLSLMRVFFFVIRYLCCKYCMFDDECSAALPPGVSNARCDHDSLRILDCATWHSRRVPGNL
jgi:hypothetical protein